MFEDPDERNKQLYKTAEETLVEMFAKAHDMSDATWETLAKNISKIDRMYMLWCIKSFIDEKSECAFEKIDNFFGHKNDVMEILLLAQLKERQKIEGFTTEENPEVTEVTLH